MSIEDARVAPRSHEFGPGLLFHVAYNEEAGPGAGDPERVIAYVGQAVLGAGEDEAAD